MANQQDELQPKRQRIDASTVVATQFPDTNIVPVENFQQAAASAFAYLQTNSEPYKSKIYHLYVHDQKVHLVVSYVSVEKDILNVINSRIKPNTLQEYFGNSYQNVDNFVEKYFQSPFKKAMDFTKFMNTFLTKPLPENKFLEKTKRPKDFLCAIQPRKEDPELNQMISNKIKAKIKTKNLRYLEHVCDQIGGILTRNPDLTTKLRTNNVEQNCNTLAEEICQDLQVLFDLNDGFPFPTYVYVDAMRRWDRSTNFTSFYMYDKKEYAQQLTKFSGLKLESNNETSDMEIETPAINSRSSL